MNEGAETKESRIWPFFLLILAIIVCSITTWRVISVWDEWADSGFDIDTKRQIFYLVDGSAAKAAGFRNGDQVISVNDVPFIHPDGKPIIHWTWENERKLAKLLRVGSTVTITVRRINAQDDPKHPGEQYISAEIPLKPYNFRRIASFFPWLGTLLAVLISLWYGARKSASLQLRLLCLGMVLTHGTVPLLLIPYFGSLIHLITLIACNMFMPVSFHTALVWPNKHSLIGRFPWLPHLIHVFFGAFLILRIWWFAVYVRTLNDPIHADFIFFLIYISILSITLIGIIIIVVQQHRRSSFWQRQQNRWFIINAIHTGAAMLIIGALLTATIAFYFVFDMPETGSKIGFTNSIILAIWATLGPLTLSITGVMAISSYRLDLAESIFKKSLIYTIISMVMALLVLAMAGGLALAAQEWAAIKEPWAIIALTIFAVGLLMPIKTHLGHRLDRRFRREVLALTQFRDHVDESILKEFDMNRLLEKIMHTLENILKCNPVFLFLKDNEDAGIKWRLAGFVKLSSGEIEHLNNGPPEHLTKYLKEKPEPTSKLKLLSRTDWQMKEELPLDLVEVLDNLQIDAVVPIKSHEEIQGIICLGPKPGNKAYSTDDLSLLGNISSKLGIGLTKALAFDMMEKSRISLEEEVASRTEELERLSNRMKYFLSPQLVESLAQEDEDHVWAMSKRVRLTIFFSDIKGFTETTDRMEPEEMSELLNHYLTEMCTIALKHGGTIDKFIGDAVMVFYGAPVATSDKDHALRCVRMAWEMQERMKDLCREWEGQGIEAPFSIRVGINTGYATVGSFGSKERLDYTVIGNQVNLASRLETNSQPGKILISYSTNALVQDEFETESKGEITVKGIPRPVKTFEVIGPIKKKEGQDAL